MSPESTDYLGTAGWSLNEAHLLLEHGHYEIASREAYTAALNAARAIIFDKTGRRQERTREPVPSCIG